MKRKSLSSPKATAESMPLCQGIQSAFAKGLPRANWCALLPIGLLLIGGHASLGATIVKANNATALNLSASWVDGSVPTSADVALWDTTVQNSYTTYLGADLSWGGIQITDVKPGIAVTIRPGTAPAYSLTLGSSGIDMSSAAGNLQIESNISLGAAQTWTVASGRLLSFGGSTVISGAYALTLAGSGTVAISSGNTYSGGTTLGEGVTVQLNSSGAANTPFGSGALVMSDNVNIVGSGNGNRYVNTAITLNGNVTFGSASYTNIFTLGGAVDIGSASRTITQMGSNSSTLIINKSVTGTGGNLTFANGGAPSGAIVRFDAGAFVSTSLTVGANVMLVANAATVLGAACDLSIQTSGTFDVLNGGQTIRSLSGGGTVTTNRTSVSTTTLTIDGGSATTSSTFSGNIVNGAFANPALTKLGSTTLILSGSNNYSGATTVSDGALRLDSANALSANSNLTFNGGVVELGAGNSSFARTLGLGAGQIQFTGDGGFGAVGSDATVNINSGAAITWGGGGGTSRFLSATQTLILSSAGSDHKVTWQNDLNLNGGSRTIKTNNGSAAVDAEVSGNIGGTGASSLVKTGDGTLALSGLNTYAGSTTVSAGTLSITGDGSINSSSGVSVNGGTFRYDSSTGLTRNVTVANGAFRYNSSSAYTGNLTFTSGTAGGSNLSGVDLSIGTGQVLAPGNSTGALAAGNVTWADGGTFQFELNDAAGTAGSTTAGWDLLNSTTLDITAGAGLFTLQIVSLDALQQAGLAGNFNAGNNYSWLFVDATSTIASFNADRFVFDTTGFTNSFTGKFSVIRGDMVGGDDSQLFMIYTAVPEPSTWAMLLGGFGMLAFGQRIRRMMP